MTSVPRCVVSSERRRLAVSRLSIRRHDPVDAIKQPIEVIVVGRHSHRRPNRTDRSSTEARTKTRDGEFIARAGARQVRGDAERMFGCARIAEAASANRDAQLAGDPFDELVWKHAAGLGLLSDGSRVAVSRSRRRHVEPLVLPRLRSSKTSHS
jgi:hypothetical protein